MKNLPSEDEQPDQLSTQRRYSSIILVLSKTQCSQKALNGLWYAKSDVKLCSVIMTLHLYNSVVIVILSIWGRLEKLRLLLVFALSCFSCSPCENIPTSHQGRIRQVFLRKFLSQFSCVLELIKILYSQNFLFCLNLYQCIRLSDNFSKSSFQKPAVTMQVMLENHSAQYCMLT